MEEQNRFKLEISEEMLELREFRDEMREDNRYVAEEIPKSPAEINEELYAFKSEFKEEFAQFRAQNDEQMADIRSKLDAIMDLLHEMRKSKGLEPLDMIGAPMDRLNSNREGSTLVFAADQLQAYDNAELGLDTTAAGNPVDDKMLEDTKFPVDDKMLEDTKLIDSEEIKGDDSAIKFVEDGNNFTEMLLLKSVGKDEGIGLNEGNAVDGVVVLSLIDLQQALGSLGDTTVNGSSNGSTKAWFEGATSIIEVVLDQNAIDDAAHKVFDEMFQSIRAVLTDEQVIDPYTNGFSFNNHTLFDPGGDRKYALTLSEGVVHPLIGKTQGTCVNGMKGAVPLLRHALSTVVSGDKHCLIAFSHFHIFSSGTHAIFALIVDSISHGDNFTEMDLKALFEEANSELLMKMPSFDPGGCSLSQIGCDPLESDGKHGDNCLEINVDDALFQANEYCTKSFGEKLKTNRLSLRHVSSSKTSKHIENNSLSVVVLLSNSSSCVTNIKNGGYDYFVKMIRNRIEYGDVQLIGNDHHLKMDDSLYTCYLPLDDLHIFTQLGPGASVLLVNYPPNVSSIFPKVDQYGMCNIIFPLSNSMVWPKLAGSMRKCKSLSNRGIKKKPIYAVHSYLGSYSTSSCMDHVTEFLVTLPTSSFTRTSMMLPHLGQCKNVLSLTNNGVVFSFDPGGSSCLIGTQNWRDRFRLNWGGPFDSNNWKNVAFVEFVLLGEDHFRAIILQQAGDVAFDVARYFQLGNSTINSETIKEQSVLLPTSLQAIASRHGIPLSIQLSGTEPLPQDNLVHLQELGWKVDNNACTKFVLRDFIVTSLENLHTCMCDICKDEVVDVNLEWEFHQLSAWSWAIKNDLSFVKGYIVRKLKVHGVVDELAGDAMLILEYFGGYKHGWYSVRSKLGWGQFSTVCLSWYTEAAEYIAMEVKRGAHHYIKAVMEDGIILKQPVIWEQDRNCLVKLLDHLTHEDIFLLFMTDPSKVSRKSGVLVLLIYLAVAMRIFLLVISKGFVWDPGLVWVCHFPTLRTRRLLRGRICHVPRFKIRKTTREDVGAR